MVFHRLSGYQIGPLSFNLLIPDNGYKSPNPVGLFHAVLCYEFNRRRCCGRHLLHRRQERWEEEAQVSVEGSRKSQDFFKLCTFHSYRLSFCDAEVKE